MQRRLYDKINVMELNPDKAVKKANSKKFKEANTKKFKEADTIRKLTSERRLRPRLISCAANGITAEPLSR
jgi:hypothetical protein